MMGAVADQSAHDLREASLPCAGLGRCGVRLLGGRCRTEFVVCHGRAISVHRL